MMRKILGIVVLSLMFCDVGFAKVLNFKCDMLVSINSDYKPYNYKDIMLLQIHLDKKEIWEYDDTNRQWWKFKIDQERSNEVSYIAVDFTDEFKSYQHNDTSVEFNRWTGEYQSDLGGNWSFNKYSCKPISKRLY